MSNTIKALIAIVSIIILGLGIFVFTRSRSMDNVPNTSISSVSQVVSSSSLKVISSPIVSKIVEVPVVSKTEQAQSISSAIVPTFDFRYQTNLKLQSPVEITSISIGKCNLQTKLRLGLCEILDQNKQKLFYLNSVGGIPISLSSASNSQIINLSSGYGVCSIIEYNFSFKEKELNILKNLSSPGCEDKSVVNEIEKYMPAYEKVNNLDN